MKNNNNDISHLIDEKNKHIDAYFGRSNELTKEQIKLQKERKKLEEKYNDASTRLGWNRKERKKLEDKIQELESKQDNKSYEQYKYDSYCLEQIRNSKSYKIGMFITFLPRKIIAFFKK